MGSYVSPVRALPTYGYVRFEMATLAPSRKDSSSVSGWSACRGHELWLDIPTELPTQVALHGFLIAKVDYRALVIFFPSAGSFNMLKMPEIYL